MLHYRIDATAPASRELRVSLRLAQPVGQAVDAAEGSAAQSSSSRSQVEFFLPTWTPGSYLIREFSRHVSRVEARDAISQAPLVVRKTSKNRWAVACEGADQIELTYRVHAHELTVRTADVNASHAFWNHACVLLWPCERPESPATLRVEFPRGWSLATSLDGEDCDEGATGPRVRDLRVANLDEAIDSPVLIGELQQREWQVDGVTHRIALDGLGPIAPPQSLCDDLARIVRCAASVFGNRLPYDSYTFLALFAGEGHGGLEHRNSSVLLMARTALRSPSGYREFLGLAAHELFHAWNVKRLRPREFWRYDYERENYSSLLWLMEGWTAYFDDLLVARAGLMSTGDYLTAMAKNVQGMLASPGRRQLSLAESSFDAWIRLYRPDENTRNSSQNYYGNGAVAALCLDLFVRRASGGTQCLDDVLRGLYERTFLQHRGYELEDVQTELAARAGGDAVAELLAMVEGPLEPRLDELLATVGIRVRFHDAGKPYIGVGFQQGSTIVASVNREGPAFDAGLAPGDELLAIAGMRVNAANWQTVFSTVAQIDTESELLIARRGLITSLRIKPAAAPGTVQLVIDDAAPESAHAARAAWLDQPSTTSGNGIASPVEEAGDETSSAS